MNAVNASECKPPLGEEDTELHSKIERGDEEEATEAYIYVRLGTPTMWVPGRRQQSYMNEGNSV